MKEAYAVRRTVPPSAEIEDQIDELLAVGVGENPRESLSGLAKLGARLIIQRAVEDEFDAWLGRARYERRPEYQRGLRNGFRPRRVQTEEGERMLLSVMLGMRESHEDWLALGRDLIARGLAAPMLIVADGAPGLVKAVEQCWPSSDRQHCAVHRVRNLLAKLPESERERIRGAYWEALDEALSESDAKKRLQALAGELDRRGYTAASKCLSDDLDALV